MKVQKGQYDLPHTPGGEYAANLPAVHSNSIVGRKSLRYVPPQRILASVI